MQRDATPLLTDLLKAVSRSFYLTLRMLPESVRPQIGLAYLLARTTDTIADTELVPVARRLAALNDFRARISSAEFASAPVSFGDLAAMQAVQPGGGTHAERMLLERADEMVGLLACFPAEDQRLIREVLATITSGQELDLQRFGNATAGNIHALSTDAELHDYTYGVAGCVGEFWTKMCRAHVFPRAGLDDAALLRDGVRFGKGLQLVNILRDLPRDLKQGRCYIPTERLERVQLKPDELLHAPSIAKLRPVYDELLDIADAHLAAGWHYTNSLPRSAVRVRLACAWPILIGAKTLTRLRWENPLDDGRRVKVSRTEVKRIVGATLLRYPFPGAWQRLFDRGADPD
ncbi:MAG TPA: phytoene/squalene synthase family protein [Methylomirabilota bacterium]|nr:phytoene/squalene synthase family protein [Methylomirabilota bacterium]